MKEYPNPINEQSDQNNISNFIIMKAKGDGKSTLRGILKSINIEENHNRIIRKEIT